MGGLEVRRAYVEQIRRDMLVLKEHSSYHVPSRQFYEDRIFQYRRALGVTKSPTVGASAGSAATHRPTPRVWVRLRRKKV